MKISVNLNTFYNEAKRANVAIANKNVIPILGHFLIDANADGFVTLSATDLSIAYRATIKANVEQPGQITVPAKRLLEILSDCADETFAIDVTRDNSNNEKVKIKSGKFSAQIQTLPVADFPAFPEVSGTGTAIMLPRIPLQVAIDRVQHSTAKEEGKHAISGAKLDIKPNDEGTGSECAMVSTDGRHMSIATFPIPETVTHGALFPAELLDALTKMPSVDEPWTFIEQDNHFFFQSSDSLLYSRMLDAKFPAYHRILGELPYKIRFDKGEFTSALKRVMNIANERTRAIRLSFAEDTVTISAESADVGDGSEPVAIQPVPDASHQPSDVYLNGQYMLDFLRVCENPVIELHFGDPLKQGTKWYDGPSETSHMMDMIMPMGV